MNGWTGEIWREQPASTSTKRGRTTSCFFSTQSLPPSEENSSIERRVEFDSNDRDQSRWSVRKIVERILLIFVVIVIKMIFIIIFCYFHSFEFPVFSSSCRVAWLTLSPLHISLFSTFFYSKGSSLASYKLLHPRRHSFHPLTHFKSRFNYPFSPFHWFFLIFFFCSPEHQSISPTNNNGSSSRVSWRWREKSLERRRRVKVESQRKKKILEMKLGVRSSQAWWW